MSRFGIPVGALHLNTLNGILPILSAQHISPFAPAGTPPLAPTITTSTIVPSGSSYVYSFVWSAPTGATTYTYSIINSTTSFTIASGSSAFNSISGVTSFVTAGDLIQFNVYASNAYGNSPTTTISVPTSPPSAPTITTATMSYNASRRNWLYIFTWSAPTGATSYTYSIIDITTLTTIDSGTITANTISNRTTSVGFTNSIQYNVYASNSNGNSSTTTTYVAT